MRTTRNQLRMFLRGNRSIEIEMAEKSREIDPNDEFQNMPDEEALLREDAAGGENCSKTKETPNE